MAVIDDILGKKKNTGPTGVIRNEEDNSTGSRGGVVRQAMPKPEGVQAPVVTPAPKVAGVPTEGMKPLPTAPEPPKPATPSNEPETDEGNGAVTTTKPQKPQPSEPRKVHTYEDMFAEMGETEEQKKAREKREKRQAVLATIADGLAAFHNSYAHARGIQPMQNIGGNSSKLAQRLYQEQKDREAKGLKLYDMKQRAEQMEDTRNWRNTQAAIANKREERLNEKLQLDKEKNDSYRKYQESLANKNNEQAAYWKAKWQALEEGKDLDDALKEAKIATERARAAQVGSSRELNEARAENERNKLNGTTTETVQDKKDAYGGTTQTHTKKTTTANAPAQKKANPMGSANGTPQNNGKKKNPMN